MALAAYRAGDVAALGRLVERYRRPLLSFLYRFTSDPLVAEEWFQETWVRALQHVGGFRSNSLSGWLFRIAHNLAVDHFRRVSGEGQRALTDENPDGTNPQNSDFAEAAGPGPTPARETAQRELGQRIQAAVAQLPVEQRETFSLRMDGRLSFKEIAEIQRCSINTVLARMQYALAKLRVALAEDYSDWKELRS